MKDSALAKLDRSLFWLSGTALAALAASLSSGFMLLTAAPLWAISGWWRRRGGEPVSRGASAGLAALVLALLLIAVTTDPRNFIEYFSMCLGGLVLVKQFDQRSVSDRAILLSIGAALVIGAALLHSSLIIGLVLFAFLIQSFRCTALLQVVTAADRADAGERPLRWTPAWRALWVCGIVTMVLMAGVFVVMPRGFMAAPSALAGSGRSIDSAGFSTEIELSRDGRIEMTYEPVLEVRFVAGDLDEFERADQLYLRGAVLDTYRDGSERASDERVWPSVHLDERTATFEEIEGDRTVYEITLFEENPKHLFTIGRTGSLSLLESSRAVLHGDPERTGLLLARGDVERYRVSSTPRLRFRPGVESETAPRVEYTDRVVEFAEGLLDELDADRDPEARHDGDDERIVRFLERRLRTEYSYTTDRPQTAPGEDPLEAFLFTHRVGHCEYFATALAALARSVGIEARVITGYLTTERTSEGGFLARNAHAHAWVEAHVAPGVWMRFDASPPGAVSDAHQPPEGIGYTMRRSWSWLSDLWVRSVISYDGGAQREFLGERYETFLDAAANRSRRQTNANFRRAFMRAAGAAAAAFAATMAIGLLAPIAAGALSGRGRRSRAGGLGGVMRRADRALTRAGLARGEWTPHRAHARSVIAARPEAGRVYDELAELHYRVRFGGQDDAGERAGDLLGRLKTALREKSD